MSATTSKEILTGTKVSNFDLGRGALVDLAENPKLHASILADEIVIPTGWLVVLKDGTTYDVKMGFDNNVWSESIQISAAPVAP